MSAGPLTLGTAGHVDHGKTSLVRSLTGTDTDRLPEERARGISIELGYAHLELPGGAGVSVVDVPGHERFVRTMVAGASGIDLFLLVVDATEGPRPQTHEHLAILRILGIEHGVAAVTKIDAAAAEHVSTTVGAVRRLVPEHEVVPVSATTGEGLPELLAALDRAAATLERTPRFTPTRLYVDRVFSLAGAGTVATGTLWSGAVGAGDRLFVLPAGFAARVRSVQVHGRPVARAEAGQRVAVGVVPDRRRRLVRGDALVEPDAYPSSWRLDVALIEDVAIPDGARVQVCHGTAAVSARLLRVGDRHAQLRLQRPVVAARGDRLVLRAETTLGGGIVLDPCPPRGRNESRLRLLESDDPAVVLAGVVDAPERVDRLGGRALLGPEELAAAVAAFEHADGWVFSAAWLEDTRRHARATLADRAGEPDPGLPASVLVGREPWAGAVAPLLGLERCGGKLYLPGAQLPARADRDDEASVLEQRLAEAGLEPLAVADPELAATLEREGRLVRLGDGQAIGAQAYRRAAAVLVEECEAAGTISLARFRDLLGSSRRVTQLLLERLDADRVTLRVGDVRRLRRSAVRR